MFSALSISGLERFVEADSLLKARQTHNWWEMDGSVKQERVAPAQAPSFDFTQIMVDMGKQPPRMVWYRLGEQEVLSKQVDVPAMLANRTRLTLQRLTYLSTLTLFTFG